MEAILETRGLTKRYEDFTLAEISVQVPRGCVTGFFGPNGAGKTTLMKLMANQVPASGGAVSVFGLSYAEREKEIKSRIGYVAQEPSYYWGETVRWTAAFVAPFFARWDGARFYRLLDEFKVSRYRKVKDLSRGQKTLMAIAFALSHEADLLILDEPTAGLDVLFRRRVLDLLGEFVAGGERGVIVSSHITDGLDEIAEYVNFLDDGRIVLQAERDDLLATWKWIHFRDGALEGAVADQLVGLRKQPFGNSGLARDYPALREHLAPGIASGDVKVENARLADVLVAMVKGA